MSRDDKQEWAEEYEKEYRGFKERNAFKIARPRPGVKINDTLTRLEYKEDNGTFRKSKRYACVQEGISRWKVVVSTWQFP